MAMYGEVATQNHSTLRIATRSCPHYQHAACHSRVAKVKTVQLTFAQRVGKCVEPVTWKRACVELHNVRKLQQVLQLLAQRLSRPVQSPLDRLLRTAHDAGNLGVRHVVVFCKHKHFALIFRQVTDCSRDLLAGLARFDVVRLRDRLGRGVERRS